MEQILGLAKFKFMMTKIYKREKNCKYVLVVIFCLSVKVLGWVSTNGGSCEKWL